MKNTYFLLLCIVFLFSSCSKDDGSPDEVKDVIITPNVGIGNISFQDNGHKVIDVYGPYERLTSVGGGGQTAFVMWFENGLGIQLDSVDTRGLSLQEVVNMSSELIDLDQPIITMVIMSPFDAATKEGVGLGSNRSEVISAFGEPDNNFGSAELYDDINMGFTYNSENILRRIDLFK